MDEHSESKEALGSPVQRPVGRLVNEAKDRGMLKLAQLDRALRQEELQQRAPAEFRKCCGTRLGAPHSVRCPEYPLGRHCQNGGDVCLAGNADGVCCPEDSCDIDERVRMPPNAELTRRQRLHGADEA